MAKLEKLFFEDPNHELSSSYEGPIVVEQVKDGQLRMEWIELHSSQDVGGVYSRIGGYSIMSNAEFSGYLTRENGHGSISMRHDKSQKTEN